MHIYVVYQDGGDEPKIWDHAYKSFADALHAVEQHLAKLNEEDGYGDEIEKETDYDGKEDSGVGVAVAHIGEGKFGHIYIRKVSVS
uniref:Uncharacterized protein n=1 Tax=viral metagenome TaxID=1070528 RepID=A0A6C0HKI0_9ZZZZ